MALGGLAFTPNWQFLDNSGNPAAGGTLRFFDALNPTQVKNVYMDADLQNPWQQPIGLDASGKQVAGDGSWYPIYGLYEGAYYLVAKDSAGNTMTSDPNYVIIKPATTGDTVSNNFATNPQFRLWWPQVLETPVPASIEPLAPGGWGFVKSNTSATDSITFQEFAVGQTEVPANPRYYFQYNCTGPGTSETSKILYWTSSDVTTFADQTISIQLWAKSTTSSAITLSFLQNFGTGGSTAVTTPIQTLSITPTWTLYQLNFNVPDLSGKTIGSLGDDYIEVQFNQPLNVSSNFGMTNYDVRPGATFDDIVEQSLEEVQNAVISSIMPLPNGSTPDGTDTAMPAGYFLKINSTSTGIEAAQGFFTGMRIGFDGQIGDVPEGWIPWISGTIGPALSNASIRANDDTFALYSRYWAYPIANCQTFSPTGVPVVRGSSAEYDFTNGVTIAVPAGAGRVIGNSGFGTAGIDHIIFTVADQATGTLSVTSPQAAGLLTGAAVTLDAPGGALPTGLAFSTTYYVINANNASLTDIQLATSIANALAGVPIVLSSNGTSPMRIILTLPTYQDAYFLGETTHLQLEDEMFNHQHMQSGEDGGGGGTTKNVKNTTSQAGYQTMSNPTDFTGGSTPFNVMQPTVFVPWIIKL